MRKPRKAKKRTAELKNFDRLWRQRWRDSRAKPKPVLTQIELDRKAKAKEKWKRNAAQKLRDKIWHQRNTLRAKRKNLVSEHMPMVPSIARTIVANLPPSFDLEDLINEGNLALVKAAERYDPAAHGGVPFSAFCRQFVRGQMLETVRRKRYIEQTRPSIDDPGRNTHAYGYSDRESEPKFETEAVRGLEKMATLPTVDMAIDRVRKYRLVSEAIALLPAAERKLLSLTYGVDEPHIRIVARRMKLTLADAEALHASAIAQLQTILTCGPRRRADPQRRVA